MVGTVIYGGSPSVGFEFSLGVGWGIRSNLGSSLVDEVVGLRYVDAGIIARSSL